MAEVVVFGVVAADVILRIPRIPAPGDHVNAEALGWRIGGSSANVACGLSTAGHHVRLVGPVGADSMGDHLLAELSRCGVDTGCPGDRGPARRAAETRTCTTTKWEVLVLADWLRCWQVSAVVMEPTSDYRKGPRVLRTWRSPRAGLITHWTRRHRLLSFRQSPAVDGPGAPAPMGPERAAA